MAKKLPYFKFFASEWNDGDITMHGMSVQGLFVNICSLYWSKEGDVKRVFLERRFNDHLEELNLLIDENLISVNSDGLVMIRFLDEQLGDIDGRSSTSRLNGKKGGRPPKPKKPNDNLKEPNKDKDKEEDKEKIKKEPLYWLDKADPIILDFCERYYLMLADNGLTKKSTKWKTKSWYDAIRHLLNNDGVTADELNAMIHFLGKHITDKYCPQVWSARSLREKWLKLKTYAGSNNSKKDIKVWDPWK